MTETDMDNNSIGARPVLPVGSRFPGKFTVFTVEIIYDCSPLVPVAEILCYICTRNNARFHVLWMHLYLVYRH
jgi:hypothetical protein